MEELVNQFNQRQLHERSSFPSRRIERVENRVLGVKEEIGTDIFYEKITLDKQRYLYSFYQLS